MNSHTTPAKPPLKRKRRRVAPLRDSLDALAHWFDSPLGKSVIEAQKEVLDEELNFLFGYHLMQLGVAPHQSLTDSSRIGHCFSMAPKAAVPDKAKQNMCDVQALAELDFLPFAEESIDVTILHHVLEFSPNPQQVLKEAARVTVPRGHIVILGFNPFSLMGVMQPLLGLMNKSPIWRRRQLSTGRIRDWLEFLDFSCVKTRQMTHNLPINHPRYLRVSRAVERVFRGTRIPFGSTYCILARKDKVSMTAIKPGWDRSSFLSSVPLRKRSVSARSSERGVVIPMRFRNPNNQH